MMICRHAIPVPLNPQAASAEAQRILHLIRVSILAVIAALACNAPAFAGARDTDWMVRHKYGIFLHYQYRILLGYSIKTKPQFPEPAQMTAEEWNRLVDGFDVKGFANQMAQANVGWVILCIDDHYFAWSCSPNKALSEYCGYAPGEKCSRRDLVMDLAEALNAKGVKLICYFAGLNGYMKEPKVLAGLMDTGKRGELNELKPPSAECRRRRLAVLKEYANRFKDKIGGWWFDGVERNTYGSEPDGWRTIGTIVHSANAGAVIAFSFGGDEQGGLCKGVDDFTAGDTWSKQDLWRLTPAHLPARDGLLWHGKIYCGNVYHGQGNANQFGDQELIDWINTCNRQGGVCTLDWPLEPKTGLLKDFGFEQLKRVAHAAEPTGFGQWKHGPPADPSYFPIAVWLQNPNQAARYKAAGVNLYLALWDGPTEQQLAELKAAGMPVICDQNAVGLAHANDSTIIGWLQPDEPDNAQEVRDPATGKRSYGPPATPQKIVDDYETMRKADPTRPIYLGLGQGVANDEWNGRGSAGKPEDYPVYALGGDILSYDIYPVAGLSKPHPEDFLWLIARGVDRIHDWTGGRKIQWNVIECTRIGDPDRQATPHQVRAEVWMSLIHGSTGIVWFVHQFKPKFNEHALLDDPPMLAAVTAINRQIHDLAPALNSPGIDAVKVRSCSPSVPVDAMARQYNGATYVFAVGMRNSTARATFTVQGLKPGASIEVIGEDRRISTQNGTFEDDFRPYDVRVYRIAD